MNVISSTLQFFSILEHRKHNHIVLNIFSLPKIKSKTLGLCLSYTVSATDKN